MKHKVMIVDDDRYIRLAVTEIFRPEGMEVVQADGADQCLELLKAGFKGVILMDIMMPHKDGWDAIRGIVEHGLMKGIVISMLTGKDVPDQKMDGLQEYVLDYITKPFDNDLLIGSVKEYFTYLDQKAGSGGGAR